jgi:hypothetical protein
VKLYLGSHEPGWLGRSTVPLFVSAARAARFGRKPALAGGYALDSGGFTQIAKGGWKMTPREYLDLVYRLDDRVPGMLWAAPQDWMCEPVAIAATGLSVLEHQQLTTENFCQLRSIDERGLIVPALQGWAPGDHEAHVEMYIDAGVDLWDEKLIGVGSVCRRQATGEIEGIIKSLAGAGLSHGFGVKTMGLARYGEHLTSADSLAWSFRARKAAQHGEGALGHGCTHRCCNNCFVWAHQWYDVLTRTSGGSV